MVQVSLASKEVGYSFLASFPLKMLFPDALNVPTVLKAHTAHPAKVLFIKLNCCVIYIYIYLYIIGCSKFTT